MKDFREYIQWLQDVQDTLVGIDVKDNSFDEAILRGLRHLGEIKSWFDNEQELDNVPDGTAEVTK